MTVVLVLLLIVAGTLLYRAHQLKKSLQATVTAAGQELAAVKQQHAAAQAAYEHEWRRAEALAQEIPAVRQQHAVAHAAYEREWGRAEALSQQLAHANARLAAIQSLGELEDALAYAGSLRAFAERELEQAKVVRQQTEAQAQALVQHAESERLRLVSAGEEVRARLVAEAEDKARQIAGSAYDLAQREGELKRTIQALENTLKGYGDDYLVPTSSVLDELETRYGFSDVGRSLKEARRRVEWMIKSGIAATCDYVEANRRETAIAFVLDAFNGKVDSILSGAKYDNYGTLRQKILDGCLLVNRLGAAFRSARIENPYLEAQIEVLKWTVAAHELKRLEKEEQRAIREQMREEEKARREYEKALKEASRDEEVARKAVEKARAELEKAGDAERAKYEAELSELTAKLQAAEERGQRAMSMAQQTRSGNVYVISNVGSFGEDVYKIGMTRRLEPEDRIRELGDASVPFSFDIHAMIRTEDAPTLEKALHKRFLREQVNKVNPRKEFFRVPLAAIRAEVEALNIQAVWTMTAACAEWKESQVIAQRLLQDASEYARWSEDQLREHERAVVADADGDEA